MTIRPPDYDSNGWFDPTTGWSWRWWDSYEDQPFYATGAVQIGPVTSTGTGAVLVKATGSAQIGSISAAGQGTVLVQATGNALIGPVIGSGPAAAPITGPAPEGIGIRLPASFYTTPHRRPLPAISVFGDARIGEVTGHGAIRVLPVIHARADVQIGDVIGRGTGRVVAGAFGKVILAEFTGNIRGAVNLSATGECSIGEITATGSGRVLVSGSGNGNVELVNVRACGRGRVIEFSDDELAAIAWLLAA